MTISSKRIRRSITAARVRAIVIAANKRVNPIAENRSGHSILATIVGAPVSPMEAGWCNVFHQSTLNLIIGKLIDSDQSKSGTGAVTACWIVERPHERNMAKIKEKEDKY